MRPWGQGPETLAKANTWQEHLVRPWRQLESSRGSSDHAELCHQPGNGPQGCPKGPLALRRCPPTHPPLQSSRGRDPHCTSRAMGRHQRGGDRAQSLPLRSPLAFGGKPTRSRGARPGSPHPGGRAGERRCPPPAPCQTFQAHPIPRPAPLQPVPSKARQAGGRTGGARAGATSARGQPPGPGRCSPRRAGYKASARWSLRLLLAQSISARRSPRQTPAGPAPSRAAGHTSPRPPAPRARQPPGGQTLRAVERRWAPRAGPPCPALPAPIAAHPPAAHLPRRRAAAAAAARPPASAGPWLRCPGPRRAATPRGSSGPERSARPGLGGPAGSGEARRGAHTAAATAQPAE